MLINLPHNCVLNRAGSVSVFGVGISIRYFRRYFFMSVRYSVSVFWNTSVFGIGIGISEILVENRKFLVYPTSIWRPCWAWPRRNFTVGSPFGKLEWWGNQAMKKYDSKFGRFDTSTWQTDGHSTTAKTCTLLLWTHYVVLIVFLLYSTHKRLFGLINRRKKLKN